MVLAVTLNMLRQPIDAGMLSALPPVAKMTDKLTPAQQLQSGCEALWSPTTAKYYSEASEQLRELMRANMHVATASLANKGKLGFGIARLSRIKSETNPKIIKLFDKKPSTKKPLAQSHRSKKSIELLNWMIAESDRRGGAECFFVTINLVTKALNQNLAKKTLDRFEVLLQRFDPAARLEGVLERGPKKKRVHAHFALFIDTSLSEGALTEALELMPCVDSEGVGKTVDIRWIWELKGAAEYLLKTFYDDKEVYMRRIKK